MSVIRVPTNFNIELEFQIPEFYRRLIALVLDMLIEFFYLRIIVYIYESIIYNMDSASSFDMWAIGLILLLPLMCYHLITEIFMNGQSFGKKIMGLRVVDENGGKASLSQFLIRWLLRLSDLWIVFILVMLASLPSVNEMEVIFIFLFGLGFLVTDVILVISSKKSQRIGDILAHTILIRTRTKTDIEDTVFQEVADSYVPSFPAIMQLSDRDINSIKSILESARKRGDMKLAESASERIKTHLKIDSALSPVDFLQTLLQDYNYLSVN